MLLTHSKLTTQGQVSVPAMIRRMLGLVQGSALEWIEDNGRIVVQRAARHNSFAVHNALFGARTPPKAKTLEELKVGISDHMRAKYGARRVSAAT